MDASRFDRWTLSLTAGSSRRDVLRGLIGATSGLALIRHPVGAARRKRTRKKPKVNGNGCLDVGKACGGNDTRCCSGLCVGRAPTRGKRDKSRCVAHDTDGCEGGQHSELCGGNLVALCPAGTGVCQTTTGKAGYCAGDGACFACAKDADCQPYCGPAAACIQCVGCAVSGGTVCASPGPGSCTFPMP